MAIGVRALPQTSSPSALIKLWEVGIRRQNRVPGRLLGSAPNLHLPLQSRENEYCARFAEVYQLSELDF